MSPSSPSLPPSSLHPQSRTSSPNSLQPKSTQPSYTVFIRLPFPRSTFTDPAPVSWSAAKDRQLWKLISRSHDDGRDGSGNLNWEELSREFGVELRFLLMQAAWLSERHMERMRRIVGRIGGGGGEGGAGAARMERGGSGGRPDGESRIATSSAFPISGGGDGADSSTRTLTATAAPVPSAPPFSRTPSSGTVTQSKVSAAAVPTQRAYRGSSGSGRCPVMPVPHDENYSHEHGTEEHEKALSSSSDSAEAISRRSNAFRRQAMMGSAKKTHQPALASALGSDGDGDDDDYSSGGGYLPFATASTRFSKSTEAASAERQGSAATLRKANVGTAMASPEVSSTTATANSTSSKQTTNAPRFKNNQSTYSESSPSPPMSSTLPVRSANTKTTTSKPAPPAEPLSSQQTPTNRSRANTKAAGGGGSEADYHSPTSIGSSFSDLEDAGVTRSALEEAVMSDFRGNWSGSTSGGGAGGRTLKGLRDALGGGGRR